MRRTRRLPCWTLRLILPFCWEDNRFYHTRKSWTDLIAANLLLPQLSAAALMQAAAKQPSWQEGGKLAGGLLFHSTLPLADLYENEFLGFTAHANTRKYRTRLVEDLIRELIELRDMLKEDEKEQDL